MKLIVTILAALLTFSSLVAANSITFYSTDTLDRIIIWIPGTR
jgi:hypothetical protein